MNADDRPEPRYEAREATAGSPALIRYVYRDAHRRRCTQFVATFESSLRDNYRDAIICAKALAAADGVFFYQP